MSLTSSLVPKSGGLNLDLDNQAFGFLKSAAEIARDPEVLASACWRKAISTCPDSSTAPKCCELESPSQNASPRKVCRTRITRPLKVWLSPGRELLSDRTWRSAIESLIYG